MISEKENKGISKFLSFVLRHQPELIGINLDEQGWANVEELIDKANDNRNDNKLTFEILNHIVETNNKKRFAFSEDKLKIRASQGHSIEIDLGYKSLPPPEILYHGTGHQYLTSILATGLEKQKRQHVHLSQDIQLATTVGQRHGKPVVLEVMSGKMHEAGYIFFLSDNNVWLTNDVPREFLSELNGYKTI